jgi:VWFA-related protein
MRRKNLWILALLALVSCASALIFEPPFQGLRVKVQRFETAGFPRVDLFFRVESGHKQDLRYLKEANLRLFEEEVEIKNFELQLESPSLSIALVLDDSGSVDPELEYLKLAATRFVEELHRLDEVAVVGFHRKAELIQGRTQRKLLMKEAIGKLRGYGATALFDGAVLGFDSIRQARGEKKMLLLTDGNDQVYFGGRALSLENADDLIARARAEGVEIYTIGLGQHTNEAMLQRIARKTGGMAWYAPHPRHLREVFDAIARSMTATYRVRYLSPNSRREKQDRTVTLDMTYQKHAGRGVGTYWIDSEVPVAAVTVKAERLGGPGPGKMRIFTRGLRGEFLQVDFTLRKQPATGPLGKIVRSGHTTIDGFGRLERPEPLLVGIPPGIYDLELRLPDQPVRFHIPHVEIAGGETTSRVVNFSRLVFHRDGDPWYDLPHPLGPTSDLIKVQIEDALRQVFQQEGIDSRTNVLFEGRLSELRQSREVGLWLPEGVYDVTLKNLWEDEDPAETQGRGAPLRNKLSAQLQVLGGRELRFDVKRKDMMNEEDVLSPEYIAAHVDENPFLRQRPESEKQLEHAMRRRKDRYLQGRFTRHDRASLGATDLYTYRNPDEIKARLAELSGRYAGPGPAPEALPVDEPYLERHHLGKQARRARLDDVAGHYLTDANPSFPDHAEASKGYAGGPGDRYDGIQPIRREHDNLNLPEETRNPFSKERLLADLREKVAYTKARGKAASGNRTVVDPSKPKGMTSINRLADRIRSKIRGEYYQPPTPEEMHNLDSHRRPHSPKKRPGRSPLAALERLDEAEGLK